MDHSKTLYYPNSVILETNLITGDENRNFSFQNPVEILEAFTLFDLERILKKIESYLEKNLHLAGYISYEAGYLFEESFKKKFRDKIFPFPLLWFGVYQNPIKQESLGSKKKDRNEKRNFCIKSISMELDETIYNAKLNKILEYIREGETYQVNFTFQSNFNFAGNPISLYKALKSEQQVSYSAMIHDGKRQILSLSPELFFKRKGDLLLTKPMKGTVSRGKSKLDDEHLAKVLASSEKTKAENSMIVDLIRNDLGKISKFGSVQVENLLKVEKFETLFQMTSSVKSTLKKNLSYFELFKSIFPGGSVTGVPKYRTMQIIQELETSPRGVYTGAVGFISKEEAIFNIPIRTVVIENKKGSMGIGSGIVWDSTAISEYKECLLKQKFLYKALGFDLIETILFKNNNFVLLKPHLERLEKSAEFFGFVFNKEKIIASLGNLRIKIFKPENPSRIKVRLLLSKSGQIYLENSILERRKKNIGIISISHKVIQSMNIFQQHKTTNRDFYNLEYNKAKENNLTDSIFLNEKGDLTEGSIYNIFIKKGNSFWTPPLSSGVLPGIMREYLLRKGKIKEKTLSIQGLKSSDSIYLCNSVRGIMRVNLK